MGILIVIVKIVYILVCIGLITIVLMQKGKVAGLSGAIGGAGETYWGKNKARSMEGGLHKVTVALAAAFVLLTLALDILHTIAG